MAAWELSAPSATSLALEGAARGQGMSAGLELVGSESSPDTGYVIIVHSLSSLVLSSSPIAEGAEPVIVLGMSGCLGTTQNRE